MLPSFQEAPISQIPALRFLQQLGYSYLNPEDVAVERKVPGEKSGGRERLFSSVLPCFGYSMRLGAMRFSWLRIPEIALRCEVQILRFKACGFRTMSEITLNKPATPLHDAQLGGYFFVPSDSIGGRTW